VLLAGGKRAVHLDFNLFAELAFHVSLYPPEHEGLQNHVKSRQLLVVEARGFVCCFVLDVL